jgi:hypothetical protein
MWSKGQTGPYASPCQPITTVVFLLRCVRLFARASGTRARGFPCLARFGGLLLSPSQCGPHEAILNRGAAVVLEWKKLPAEVKHQLQQAASKGPFPQTATTGLWEMIRDVLHRNGILQD